MNKPVKTNYYVKKDNELTKAQFYDLSVVAYRIILLASTDKFLKQVADNNGVIRISPLDYHEIFGQSGDTSPSYRVIKNAADELLNAKIKYKAIKKDGELGTWRGGVNWVSRAEYNDTLKVLEFKFSDDVLPLVYAVQTKYTYYSLRNIAKLKSIHSIRLYELMMLWRKKNSTPKLTIQYMRTWLGVEDTKYTETKDFTKHVIKKSALDITTNTDIELEYVATKDGKTTDGFCFSYIPKNVQINGETGEDETQDGDGSNFPPPNEADDEDPELPF